VLFFQFLSGEQTIIINLDKKNNDERFVYVIFVVCCGVAVLCVDCKLLLPHNTKSG
jgi:hypothetical protein